MTPEAHIPGPVRVSIFERLVPSFAFAIAAISGAIGSAMLFRLLSALRQAESAGLAALFGGVAEIEFTVGVVLAGAAVLCGIGILVSIVRLFTMNTTASPPGLLFLMTGLLSLLPPFALHYVLHLMKEVVRSPEPVPGGIASVANTVTTVGWFSIGSAVVIALVLLAFSFIPFSSRAGRKSSPLVCLMVVEILIILLTGIYFWEGSNSLADRDRGTSSTDTNIGDRDPDGIAKDADNTYPGTIGTNSTSRGKTISGGVLNGKANSLPQPAYPPTARAARATGAVMVQVLVDEKGEVVSATAVSGHPLLRSAAVQAARQARFAPTKLSGQPVKVNGVLTYNFSGE
ncbi:MAG: TonB family protein [Pyrinomonadaceae bacterium]